MTVEKQQFGLADTIEYAPHSVVSKTILKKATGNITLFAFDKGEGLSSHRSPFVALLQVLDGVADVTIGDEMITVGPGEAVILPSNITHALNASSSFKMMLTMIKG